MTTYTVLSPSSGEPMARGLTAVAAAQEVLGHDNHLYELRREPDSDVHGEKCWQLYVSQRSAAGYGGAGKMVWAYAGNGLVRTYAPTETEAWPEIASMVIAARWHKFPDVMTDADYDAMMAGAE